MPLNDEPQLCLVSHVLVDASFSDAVKINYAYSENFSKLAGLYILSVIIKRINSG